MYRRYAELKDEETDTETEREISDTAAETAAETAETTYHDEQHPSPKIDVTLNEASRSDVRQFWVRAVSRKFRRRRFAVTEEELKKDFFHLQIALTVETLIDHGMI